MTDSKLISSTVLSPNFNADRKLNGVQYEIDTITPHCTAGNKNNSAKQIASGFSTKSRQASCNYAIGGDGSVCLVVHEKDRSWCSGGKKTVKGETGRLNDFHAVTIEVASDISGDNVNEAAFSKLKELCIDIMKRNGKTRAVWFGDNAEKMVTYQPAANEMKFTWHRWFAKKACPGKFIMEHMQEAIDDINAYFASAATAETPAETPTTAAEEEINLIEKGDTVKINANRINDIINTVTAKLCGPLLVADLNASLATINIDVQVDTKDLTEVGSEPIIVDCTPYIIKVQRVLPLNIYQQPKDSSKVVSKITTAGTYTIVAQTTDSTYGKLKSGVGYVKLADIDK